MSEKENIHQHHHDHCCGVEENHGCHNSHDHHSHEECDEHSGCHCHEHSHSGEHEGFFKNYLREIISLVMLIAGILLVHFGVLKEPWALIYYIVAVLPVGWEILVATLRSWARLDFFNEFSLMLIASVGAFILGEYPEALAILLFYSIGEKMEDSASDVARDRIKSLLGGLPGEVTVKGKGGCTPEDVAVGDTIVVKPGERVAIDGILAGVDDADFDTSAITGESLPMNVRKGEAVNSGAIPLSKEVEIVTTKAYSDSTMSRIMAMIEEAAGRKSHSETLLRRITRWYTPAVMAAALLLFAVPWVVALISGVPFEWHLWLNRALVLLVCSCPCALVVSIPLSYFAAMGNASRFGVLFKGSRYLDALRSIDTLILDKTGTVTTGVFHIEEISAGAGFGEEEVLSLAAAADSQSSHPLAKAICAEADSRSLALPQLKDVVTVNHGIQAEADGRMLLVGSATLMRDNGVAVGNAGSSGSMVYVALGGVIAGHIALSDTLKPDTAETIRELHSLGIKRIEILSGDRDEAVKKAAEEAGADGWRGHLLPQDKHRILEELQAEGHKVAFTGDGINDAPSLAAANVGIAIGTGGTDVAMESADAVITGYSLKHLADAVCLSGKIKRVVAQNVTVAIGVKLLVMILGAFGIATLWAAVFADTGITLLTVAWTLLALRK